MRVVNPPGPKAQAIIARDRAVVSPSYPRAYSFVMDHGKGVEVWDVDGNRYLDFAAGIAVAATGHSHPRVVKAIQEQAEKFIHISSDFYHESWVALSEKLNQIAPFSEPAVTFLTNSGTESVEAAIKLARYHTGRTQFIAFLGAFHGRTVGAVTMTASRNAYRGGFYPLMNGAFHVPFPDPYRPILAIKPDEDYGNAVVRYIEDQILARLVPPEDVAGIIIEPVQGEGGYIVPPQSFFPALRELCDRHEILLIVDEVQSGMGRTGKWWAIEHFGVEPDLVCSAKGIASGVPLGALIARKSVMTWPKGSHGNTYGGNPLACEAALATIGLIEESYMENTVRVGSYTMELCEKLYLRHPTIGQVRGIGLMIGIEFVRDRDSKEPATQLRDHIVDYAFEKGLILLGCGKSTIRISPPLMVSKSQVDEAFEILEEAILVAEKEYGLVVA